MAEKRAIAFQQGLIGLTCSAAEVTIEVATELHVGVFRRINNCPEPMTEVVEDTGFCSVHAEWFRQSPEVSTVEVLHRSN